MSRTQTGGIDIRPMRWWQVSRVHELELGLFPEDAWSLEQFWQELGQRTRQYVVALDGNEVLGYAGVFVLPPDADVQTIGVRADRQGEGIASRLLSALVDEAARRGATHLLLEVRSDNERAIGLYRRSGFESISRRTRYYPDGGDAIIMRRPLRTGTIATEDM